MTYQQPVRLAITNDEAAPKHAKGGRAVVVFDAQALGTAGADGDPRDVLMLLPAQCTAPLQLAAAIPASRDPAVDVAVFPHAVVAADLLFPITQMTVSSVPSLPPVVTSGRGWPVPLPPMTVTEELCKKPNLRILATLRTQKKTK